MDLSLDEIIALNKSSSGRGARGRGRRGSGRGARGAGFGQRSGPKAITTTVQTVRKNAQQSARQVSRRARANLLNRKRNISATTDVLPTAAVPSRGVGRGEGSGRGQRGRGRGRQTQGPVATAGRGRGLAGGRGRGTPAGRGRGAAVGRGRGIGNRIKRTATEGFVTVGKQQNTNTTTEVPATQSSGRGRKRFRRSQATPMDPKSIQISVVQDIENEPIGVELPAGFGGTHHTSKLLNERFMPPDTAQKAPKRLVLPNGRSVSYQD